MTLAFRCERDSLHAALAMVARVAAKDGYGVCSGAKLTVEGDKLRLEATDFTMSATTTVPVDGITNGVAAVAAKRMADMVHNLREGAVTVECDESAVTMRSGKSKGRLPLMRAAEFPRMPDVGEGEAMEWPALRAAIGRVLPCASHDEKRPTIVGVLFDPGERLTLAATDGYRMAMMRTDATWRGEKAAVPATALRELLRLPEAQTVTVASDGNAIAFGVGETTMTAQLIAEHFDRYAQLERKEPATPPYRMEANVAELAEAVKRVASVGASTDPMRWAFDGAGALELSCQRTDGGKGSDGTAGADEVEVGWEGGPFVIGLSPSFVLDALAAVATELVAVTFEDRLKACYWRSVPADGHLTVIVPNSAVKE